MSMSSPIFVPLMILFLPLAVFGYGVLTLACVAWWRRVHHWAFAVLALAFLFYTAMSFTDLIVSSGFSWRGTEIKSKDSDSTWSAWYYSTRLLLNFIGTVLLTAGGVGFLAAARDRFMFCEETSSRPVNPLPPITPTLRPQTPDPRPRPHFP